MLYNIKDVFENKWAHSSAGRASALQAEGHRFEPYCAHHLFLKIFLYSMWAHSSAGRASALQAEGHRFEPYCAHHFIFKEPLYGS